MLDPRPKNAQRSEQGANRPVTHLPISVKSDFAVH
jgi:hypothetical protein